MTDTKSKNPNQSARGDGPKQESDENCNRMSNLSISRGKDLTGNKRARPNHSSPRTHSSNDCDTTLPRPSRSQRPLQALVKLNQPLSTPGIKNHISDKGSTSVSRRSAREKSPENTGDKSEKGLAQDRKARTQPQFLKAKTHPPWLEIQNLSKANEKATSGSLSTLGTSGMVISGRT